jgi:two-component system, LuxR family, response regulator FixJ
MTQRRDFPSTDLVVIVVVDDDTAVRNSLEFSLGVDGFTVRSYADGDALLADEDLTSCDCLVIDQKLPSVNGLDLIALLRKRQVTAPAILITSHPSQSLRDRAARAGVSIVEKPLLGNGLSEMIRSVVDTRHDGPPA